MLSDGLIRMPKMERVIRVSSRVCRPVNSRLHARSHYHIGLVSAFIGKQKLTAEFRCDTNEQNKLLLGTEGRE